MIDRIAMLGLFLLLSSESFLTGFVGANVAAGFITVAVGALAYRSLIIRVSLSYEYRAQFMAVLRRTTSSLSHASLFLVFVLLFSWSFVRAVQVGTLAVIVGLVLLVRWVSVVAILLTAVVNGERRGRPDHLLQSLAFAFLAYSSLNVALYLAGVQNPVVNEQYIGPGEHGLMFGLLSLQVKRAPVAIGGGINTGGLQSAAGIAMGLVMLRQARRFGVSRLTAFVLAATSGFLVLLADSRGAMMAALFGAGGALFLPSLVRRRAKWLALAMPVLPFVALAVLQLFGQESWMGRLSRTEGTSAVALLSGRPLIWASVLGFLADFRPAHLFGYGALGQVGSGVSALYSKLFSTMYAHPEYASAHNTLLQAILDIGYVGAAVQIALFWSLLSSLGGSRVPEARPWDNLAFALTLFLLLLGVTDITVNSQMPNTMLLFLALNVHALTRPDVDARQSAPAAVAASM